MTIEITIDYTQVIDPTHYADYYGVFVAGDFTSDDGYLTIFSEYDQGNSLDENGFYYDIAPIFNIIPNESFANVFLEKLSSEQLALLCQVVPYTFDGYDESNPTLELLSIGYNGLTDPVLLEGAADILEDFESDTEDDTVINFSVTYDYQEISGLRSRFGYEAGSSISDIISDGAATIALEAASSYISERKIYHRTTIVPLQGSFSTFDYVPVVNLSAFNSITPFVLGGTSTTGY